jgi:small subunit ribosomal protein S6
VTNLSAEKKISFQQYIPKKGGKSVNSYELTVILRNNEIDAQKDKVKSILQKAGAQILEEENWGHKRLAYGIDGENEGFYMLMKIDAPSDAVEKINQEFGLIADILRFMFVKLKKTA